MTTIIFISVIMFMHIYIYIYIERERDKSTWARSIVFIRSTAKVYTYTPII